MEIPRSPCQRSPPSRSRPESQVQNPPSPRPPKGGPKLNLFSGVIYCEKGARKSVCRRVFAFEPPDSIQYTTITRCLKISEVQQTVPVRSYCFFNPKWQRVAWALSTHAESPHLASRVLKPSPIFISTAYIRTRERKTVPGFSQLQRERISESPGFIHLRMTKLGPVL